MKSKELEAKKLEQRIKARQRLIRKYAEFIERVTREIGENTLNEEHRYYFHTKYKLQDFNGFSVRLNLSQTEFGSNDIEITYKNKIVLSIYYQVDLDDFKIREFSEKSDWQQVLSRLMRREGKAVGDFKKEKESKKKDLEEAARQAERLNRLKETAKKLAIPV